MVVFEDFVSPGEVDVALVPVPTLKLNIFDHESSKFCHNSTAGEVEVDDSSIEEGIDITDITMLLKKSSDELSSKKDKREEKILKISKSKLKTVKNECSVVSHVEKLTVPTSTSGKSPRHEKIRNSQNMGIGKEAKNNTFLHAASLCPKENSTTLDFLGLTLRVAWIMCSLGDNVSSSAILSDFPANKKLGKQITSKNIYVSDSKWLDSFLEEINSTNKVMNFYILLFTLAVVAAGLVLMMMREKVVEMLCHFRLFFLNTSRCCEAVLLLAPALTLTSQETEALPMVKQQRFSSPSSFSVLLAVLFTFASRITIVGGNCPAGKHQGTTEPCIPGQTCCEPCYYGQYQAENGYNGFYCNVWSLCAAGHKQNVAPSFSVNRGCTKCDAGRYQPLHLFTGNSCVRTTACCFFVSVLLSLVRLIRFLVLIVFLFSLIFLYPSLLGSSSPTSHIKTYRKLAALGSSLRLPSIRLVKIVR